MAEVNPSLAKEAFIILRNLLSNLNNYHENIMHAAGTSLVELIELIPFDKTRYKQVHELLKIIKLTWHKDFHHLNYLRKQMIR
ncbi:hypothetical protein SB78_06770 [Rickettsia asembonensis]|uniref:Uncharacterized protein n=2 Tax=Rickettsia asembonensis TaxID=1068590 RepID=A0A0C2MM21_9RICK|nr:hypothetical protein SB78_06770 [Rickettsia asembonensis]